MSGPSDVLVVVRGADRPGVTAALFAALDEYAERLLDLEQVIVRGQLLLGVVVRLSGSLDGLRDRLAAVRALGVDVEVSAFTAADAPAVEAPLHVTVLAEPLTPRAMGAVATTIADAGGNIARIERLASYPVDAYELEVTGADATTIKAALAATAVTASIDLAVQPGGLLRRAKRLVMLDVDSTLIQGEVIDMLAERAGADAAAEVARVTAAAMSGGLDFADSLRARVAHLTGLPETALDEVRDAVRLTPGARTLVRTLKHLGYAVGVVSGGFTQVVGRIADELELDYAAANTLEIAEGRLTGRVLDPIVDRPGKAARLREFAAARGVPMEQTVAIGDGANDLDMLEAAGLGVAFNAKQVVREAADTAVSVPYLDAVLFLLGITRREIELLSRGDAGTVRG